MGAQPAEHNASASCAPKKFVECSTGSAQVPTERITPLEWVGGPTMAFLGVDLLNKHESAHRMEQLNDDALFAVLGGGPWNGVGAGEGIMTGSNLRSVTRLRLVSWRWYRIVHECFLPRIGYLEDADYLALTDCACMMFYNLAELRLTSMSDPTVRNTRVTTTGLACMTRLDVLILGDHPSIDYAAVLPTLTSLRTLCLDDGCRVDDATISRMTWLQSLGLGQDVCVGDNGLTALAQLTWLALDGNDTITASVLTTLTQLTALDVSHNAHLDCVAVACLPSLHTLHVRGFSLLGETHLYAMTQLRSLDLSYNASIDVHTLLELPLLEEVIREWDRDTMGEPTGIDALNRLRARGVRVDESKPDPPEPPVVAEEPHSMCSVQ